MFVKLTNGQPSQFPYSLGQLRRDNPQISFPKVIPESILAEYEIYPVQKVSAPYIDNNTHRLQQSVAQAEGAWVQEWTMQELPQQQAESNVRSHRDRLLSNTDWMALSDNTMTSDWASYRQSLRDVSSQAGFPYAVDWPDEPE